MKMRLSTILLSVTCIALSAGMVSERVRFATIERALSDEREQFEIQRREFIQNRQRIVTAALSFGAGPQSELPKKEMDEDDDRGFTSLNQLLTKEDVAIQDLIEFVNIWQDIPRVLEIAFPDEHSEILPIIEQSYNEEMEQLWHLSGRKTLAEIYTISSDDSSYTIKRPNELKTLIEKLSKSAR